MATAPGRTRCITCGKEKVTSKCSGCCQDFCYSHLGDHRLQLSKELDEIEVHRDQFQEKITEKEKTDLQKHPLIQQIDQWENESIEKIKETAKEARKLLVKYTNEHIIRIKENLNKLTEQVKHSKEEDDIMEIDLRKWKEDLQQMVEQLNKPPNIVVQESSKSLINKLQVEFLAVISVPIININAKWSQNGITVAGGEGQGDSLNQLYNPWGAYVDDDQTIYVADTSNHRIVKWKKGKTSSELVAGGKGAGNRNDQLNYPINVVVDKENDSFIICDYNNRRVVRWPRRNGINGETIISNIGCCDVIIDNNGHLYVADVNNHEVRRWKIGETSGTLVAGGNGPGSRFDQLNQPYHIFVDQDHSVYVSDYGNHRVMKWIKDAKEGIRIAGSQNSGDGLKQLSGPRGIIVDQQESVYIADQNNHRVMRWLKGATEGSIVVGGNKSGTEADQFNGLIALSFDRESNLYVTDYLNDRVQKFNIESNFIIVENDSS